MYDCIVIGSGPAGYTAGIYSVRAGLKTLILEGSSYGGQLMYTTEIENYPGFPEGINGYELMTNMRNQCKNLGCELIDKDVISVDFSNYNISHRVITMDDIFLTKTVIVATGATANKLEIENGDIYWNKGISACAVCDGALPVFRKKPLAVVGGGDTACEEAIFLSRFGSIVYVLVRGSSMRASHKMKKKLENHNNIIPMFNTEVIKVDGIDDHINQITVKNNLNNINQIIPISGLFYGIGHTPNTSFLSGVLDLDENGYIITKNTITNIPGVFACGDVQDKIYRQAITASSSGCIAALEAEKYLSSLTQ